MYFLGKMPGDGKDEAITSKNEGIPSEGMEMKRRNVFQKRRQKSGCKSLKIGTERNREKDNSTNFPLLVIPVIMRR